MAPYTAPTPGLADTMPKNESSAGSAGSETLAPRADHQHPRITWSGVATTNGSGVATFDFSAKPFTTQPVAVLAYVEVGGTPQPVILRVSAWTQDGQSRYIGCAVTAQRAQTIPQNLATLLLGAVFNLFAGNAVGIQVNLVLIPQSGVS